MRGIFFLTLTLSGCLAQEHVLNQEDSPGFKNVKIAQRHLTEADVPLLQDEAADKSLALIPDSEILNPENPEEQRETEETSVVLEEPILQADYLLQEEPETELIQETAMDKQLESVEESGPGDNIEVKFESQEHVVEEPKLEADYIVAEEPAAEMDVGRNRRKTLTRGRHTCRGVKIQDMCYQFFQSKLNAYDAELQCQKVCHKGHLASVTSSFIRDKIYRLVDQNNSYETWLGGRRVIGTNTFKWLNGAPWIYNGFFVGEPNNLGGNEDCVEILNNVGFNDVACFLERPFICSCPV